MSITLFVYNFINIIDKHVSLFVYNFINIID